MKFGNTKVMNFEGAFRGMRNPLESWHKSDSFFGIVDEPAYGKCGIRSITVHMNKKVGYTVFGIAAYCIYV